LEHLLKGRAALVRALVDYVLEDPLLPLEEGGAPSRPKRRCQKDCLSLIPVTDSFA
jgi:hypothetical protein